MEKRTNLFEAAAFGAHRQFLTEIEETIMCNRLSSLQMVFAQVPLTWWGAVHTNTEHCGLNQRAPDHHEFLVLRRYQSSRAPILTARLIISNGIHSSANHSSFAPYSAASLMFPLSPNT